MMTIFKAVIIVQLFFSFGITLYVYALDDTYMSDYVTSFSGVNARSNLTSVSQEMEASLNQQTQIPLVDIGALIFYSGNIILDLILNFIFAIPEMIGLVVAGIIRILNIPTEITVIIQSFTAAMVLIFYVLSLMQFLMGVRSGKIV